MRMTVPTDSQSADDDDGRGDWESADTVTQHPGVIICSRDQPGSNLPLARQGQPDPTPLVPTSVPTMRRGNIQAAIQAASRRLNAWGSPHYKSFRAPSKGKIAERAERAELRG